ncbi:MAG: hypothetical protein V2A74_00925, partial [bacterium]
QINGEEVYEIRDASGQVADGPTVPLMQGMNSQRIAPGLPPEDPNSWILAPGGPAYGTPGRGAGPGGGAGLVINEDSDTTGPGTLIYEFVELYYDGPVSPPRISGATEDSGGRLLTAGETLGVTLSGTPEASATFRLEGITPDIALTESNPGTYEGTWKVPRGARAGATRIVSSLVNAGGKATTSSLAIAGVDGGETLRHDDFEQGISDWDFGNLQPTYSSPNLLSAPQAITMQTTSNVDNYGFWKTSLNLELEADSLYVARVRMRSDLADPTPMPQIRLRLTSLFTQWNGGVVLDSRHDGLASPGTNSQMYSAYLMTGNVKEGDRLGFVIEMINFNASDSSNATLYIENVEVLRLSPRALGAETPVGSYSFDEGSEGWTFFGHLGTFSTPESSARDGALRLRSANNVNCYGFWQVNGLINATEGELYGARFRVSTDSGELARQPQLRFRFFPEGYQQTAFLIIDSASSGEASPRTGGTDYTLLLDPVAGTLETPSDHLGMSFEIVNFNLNDLPDVEFALEEARIVRFDNPLLP